jgi:hypothetical protein
MSQEHEEPDHTDTGQGRDVGAGYPEEQPGGANPGPANDEGDGREASTGSTSGPDSGPAGATGNPGAAGG